MHEAAGAKVSSGKTDGELLNADGRAAAGRSGWWPFGVVGTALFLGLVWWQNFNFVGETYDYSILTSGVGWLQQGRTPYRDFITPLQSFPLYVARFAEWVWGPRYLSLAYANLVAGLLFFAAMLRLLRGRLPDGLRLLTAAALVAASFFQHGILWYNAIAMALLALVVVLGAILHRQAEWATPKVALLGFLLLLLSMTKINFHAAAVGLLVLLLAERIASGVGLTKRLFGQLVFLVVAGAGAGPALEMVFNGCSPRIFLENIVFGPPGRIKELIHLIDPKLYFDKNADFYPDNWSSGLYLKAFLLFCVVAYSIWKSSVAEGKTDLSLSALPCRALAWLGVIFGMSLLITVTNTDTQMLTALFLLIGVVAYDIMFAARLERVPRLALRATVFVLAGIFFLAGSGSAFRHSRLRFAETKRPGYHTTAEMSAGMREYFAGARLSDLAWQRFSKVDHFMMAEGLLATPEKVYWGAGLEILNRPYHGILRGRVPLWYHRGVTVPKGEAPALLAELRRLDYQWIVLTWSDQLPDSVNDYLKNEYQLFGAVENNLSIFRRVR